MYQNNQATEDDINALEDLIPSLNGGGHQDETNFILEATVLDRPGEGSLKTNVLVDTGANISTITRKEAERLSLNFVEAAPVRIIYGNQSSGISKQSVWMNVAIQGMELGGFFLRVVETQNLSTILGMDWLL